MNPRRLTCLAVLALLLALPALVAGGAQAAARDPIPVFAHYYIWFQPTSWDRAKRDYPLIGRYSSDERDVMLQHVRWAMDAGIRGFIVSWKDTPQLSDRLAKLVDIAGSKGFKLAIMYQGLDFNRVKLPIDQVARDMRSFAVRYAENPVFHVFGQKPVVVLSGSWEYTRAELERLQPLRTRILLLASEKNVEGYDRVADLVDGDLYYWSSVNPSTYPDYPGKLVEMSQAVHAHHGIWIAPAAPGFDATLLGKTTVVDRDNGATFRSELAGAFASSPDAVGVISWNEFSENTYIEPSERYRETYLRVLADYLHAKPPVIGNFDSNAPAATGVGYGLPLLLGLTFLAVVGIFIASSRRRPGGGSSEGGGGPPAGGGGGGRGGPRPGRSKRSGPSSARRPGARKPLQKGS